MPDPAQLCVAERLQLLADRLARWRPSRGADFFSFFSRRREAAPQGLYLFGPVGCGKTMLMDLFFEQVAFAPRRRLHFHEFMAEAHEAIARVRKVHDGDPIPIVAQILASEAQLVCFDEFHVTDIADAMVLGRLFEALFAQNVVVVATSNTPPRGLYEDGLNRKLFEPFIALIEERMDVLELPACRDYRHGGLGEAALYFTPSGPEATARLRAVWRRVTGLEHGAAMALASKGRKIRVREHHGGAAWFGFDELCEEPLGAGDYLALARAFHTVFVEAIPVLGPDRRSAARRLVHLVDALYDNSVRLVASADAEPEGLYRVGDGAGAFARTASRLGEMRTGAHLARPGRRDGKGGRDTRQA